MPALAHRLRGGSEAGPASARRSSGDGRPSGTHSAAAQGELSPSLQAIAGDLPDPLPPSPASLLLPTRTPERFRRFGNAATTVAHAFDRLGESLDFQVAYSVKTNPHPDLIDAAREAGFWAETIHPDEIRHVRSRGFPPDQIVLNGPLQHGLHDRLPSLRAAFADSIGDLAEMLEADRLPAIAGLRIRPAEPLSSRFGVDLNDPDRFDRCCELVSAMPPEVQFGLHVHHASSTAGHERWWDYLRSAVHWGKAIQSVTGRAVEVLDFGGGWHPDDWLDVFIPGLIDRAAALRDAFPDLSRLIAEPGKALCQPLGVVVSRVVDVRRESDGSTTAVVDASIAELSNVDFHPHRVLARSRSAGNGSEGGDWYRLTRGSGTLYGRLCMEEDVLAGPVDLRGLEPGDPVVFCDAGAYDMSMTYPFGRGRTATAPDYEGGPSSRSDGSPSDGRERLSPNPPTPPRPNS
jgi:diaminopimelate decarboxylase